MQGKYYEYILVYTDDILVISHELKEALIQLDQHFLLKRDSIKEPDLYLGSQIMKHWFSEDPSKSYWVMGLEKYVKDAIRQVKEWLTERNGALKAKAPSVLLSGYHPELDVSEYCNQSDAGLPFPYWDPSLGG